jgi:hypothetical protein
MSRRIRALGLQAHQQADSSSSGGGLNALARVAFEKHLADAHKHVIIAMKAQSAFWKALQVRSGTDDCAGAIFWLAIVECLTCMPACQCRPLRLISTRFML